MEGSHNVPLQENLKSLSNYLAYLVILLAVLVIAGWQFEIGFLKRPIPALAAMNPTSAVLFILSGVSFLLLSHKNNSNSIYFWAYCLITLVFIIAFIKLVGIIIHIDIGVDRFIFSEKIKSDLNNNVFNSMAPNTAFCFLLISAGIRLLKVETSQKKIPAHYFALTTALIVILSIIGYIYRVQAFYGMLAYIPMAIHTAIAFLLFSMALLFATPDKGVMKELTSTYTGSETALFLIPAAILIPVFLGYLRLLEYWYSSGSTEFSVAILMLCIIIIFVSLIWHNSVSLNKKDALRKDAEEQLALLNKELESRVLERTEKLKISELEYSSLIEQATDGIFISDNKGKYTDVNLSACKMLGYTKEELLQLHSSDILLKEDAKINPPKLDELRAGKTLLSTRLLQKKDGSTVPVEITGKMLLNGKMLGMVRDITERKIAEGKLAESELLFRQTLDNMLEGVQIHDFDWRYTYVNNSLVKYSQYTKEELMGSTLMEKYPGIEHSDLFKVLERCMKEKVREHFETEFHFPNGSTAYFELSVQPIATGLFILSIDITERKKAEEKIQKLNEELEQKVKERTAQLENNILQLQESEERFQKAFRASAAGMTLTRLSDGRFLEVNDAFVEMTGFTREESLGYSSAELGMTVDLKKREEVLQRIKEYGSAKHFEMTVRNKSGELLEVLASVETITLNGEKYAINIIFDITDRKKAEEQLELVNKELEAFSYSVSHDLRAPLRAIDGYAKLLEEDYQQLFDEEGKRLLGVIQSNSKKMSSLIDDLLEFSRLGRKTVQKTTLNMNAMIDSVWEDINKSIEHNAEMKVGFMHPAEGDYTLINQVIINLLSNAVKYSSKKTSPVIEVTSEENEVEVIYSIKDNGAGFDMQYADKLFGVFQRLHSSKEFEGTGVGLAIVQRIINKHAGKVWAEAILGEGATFYFTLPKN